MRSMHNWEGDKAQGKGSEAVNGKSSAVLLAANMVAKREHRTFSICIAISICAPSRWSTFDYFIFFLSAIMFLYFEIPLGFFEPMTRLLLLQNCFNFSLGKLINLWNNIYAYSC